MVNISFNGRVEELIPKLFSLPRDIDYDISIKEHKEKRSLNANSYCWLLIGKIADNMNMSKEEVYKRMLVDYGQGETFVVSSNVNLDSFIKYYSILADKGGQKMVRAYRGSSEYDTYEMSVFISGIVQEAENLGIETLSPQKLKALEDSWNG